MDNYRDLFESRISAGGTETLLYSENSEANFSSWSYDMEDRAKKCVERYYVLTTVNSQKKKQDPLVNCQKCVLKLFRNVCTWLELVDLIFCGQ